MTSLTDDAYVGTLHYKDLDPPISTADLQATCDAGNATTTAIECASLDAVVGNVNILLGGLDVAAGDASIEGNCDVVSGILRAQNSDIIADNGNIKATAGNIEATAGSVVANADITATTGNIKATAGSLTSGANIYAGTHIEADHHIISNNGNILTAVGHIYTQAGDIFTELAGNLETKGTGNITSKGNLTIDGNGNYSQTGTGTFTSGSGANKLLGRIESQAGIDIPLTNDAGTQILQNYIKNNMTFQAQVKFLGQINGTIGIPEFCPIFPNAQYKTYTLDTTLPKQEYALSLLATGDDGSLMFDLHTSHGHLRQNYSFEVNSFCADEKGFASAPYVLNWAVYPPNNGTSNTDCCIQINYSDYDASHTQVMRMDCRIFYNPSPP